MSRRPAAAAAAGSQQVPPRRAPLPDLRDPRFALERETLKLVVQEPAAVAARPATSAPTTSPIRPTGPSGSWSSSSAGSAPPMPAGPPGCATAPTDQAVAAALSALAVEPVPSRKGADDAFVANTVYRLQELTAQRRIADVKSRLQRTNPVEHTAEYNRMFGELPPSSSTAASSATWPWAPSEVAVRSPPRATAGRGGRRGSGCWPGPPVADGEWVAGTRDALYLPGGRLPWEQVEAADWDHDPGRLRVSEVGRWGEPRSSTP